MSTGAIIQARTTSARLPGKVLKELPYGSGVTVLEQVIRRLKKSKSVDMIIVATTANGEDDAIVAISEKEEVGHFRGSEKDVLSRYYHAAKKNSVDTVVRITSDCPCVDPEVVDAVIHSRLTRGVDYASNSLERSYPHGLDVEVFTLDSLERAFKEASEDFEKEHVTPYIYRSGKFSVGKVEAPARYRRPDIRITLDTREDYILLCAVYGFLYDEDPSFGAGPIIALFDAKPWLSAINGAVVQKKIFSSLEEELSEAEKILDLQDLARARDYLRRTYGRKK